MDYDGIKAGDQASTITTGYNQSANMANQITWDEGMVEKVTEYIHLNNLIHEGDKIVVGVSGGADSVCLLHILCELYRDRSVDLFVAHIHHGIRGEAADGDEAFVRRLAEKLQLPYFCYHYDVPRLALEMGMSEEEAGRELRYKSFLEICTAHGCNKIAIAHNRNDNAETVLFHLFRGSGIKGLGGIPASRELDREQGNITIIRPLLPILREEIEAYLEQKQIEYHMDASNLSESYSRNKLRHHVLSYVTDEINEGAVIHVTEAAEELREAGEYLDKQVRDRYEKLVRLYEKDGAPVYELDAEALEQEDMVLRKGILMKVLESLTGSRKDIGRNHVLSLLQLSGKQVGKQISLPYGIEARRGYDTLTFYRQTGEQSRKEGRAEPLEAMKLTIPGYVLAPPMALVVETGLISNRKGLTIPKNSCTKWFDYDKIENALELRTRREGDYLQINSLGGRKKLKAYFIDQKVPMEERDRVPLIADGSHILWILGDHDRMSEKYKITEQTNRILWIKINNAEEKEYGR